MFAHLDTSWRGQILSLSLSTLTERGRRMRAISTSERKNRSNSALDDSVVDNLAAVFDLECKVSMLYSHKTTDHISSIVAK